MRLPCVSGSFALVAALLLGREAGAVEPIHPSFSAPALEQGSDLEAMYELNALGVVRRSSPSTWWRPVRGKYRWAMSYEDFFTHLGRPDLAEEQDRRQLLKGTLFWGSFALTLGGGFLFVHGMYSSGFGAEAAIGAGVAAGGIAAQVTSRFIRSPVVPADEAEDMAARYNQALAGFLGLSPAESGAVTSAPARLKLQPVVGHGFGGVAVVGAF